MGGTAGKIFYCKIAVIKMHFPNPGPSYFATQYYFFIPRFDLPAGMIIQGYYGSSP